MIQIIINNIANKVRSTVLTGLNTSLTGVITATDTVLEAFGKLQKQINDKADSGAVGSSGITMATSRILGRTTAGTGAIEEISVGTGLSLSGGTLSATAVSGGITVGTTAVTSGTIGRVFFEGAGNVVQQDGGLFWDNTNKLLGVGATPATTVRLDVRARGGLSSDVAFRVRNSANSLDIFSIAGESTFNIGSLSGGNYIQNDSSGLVLKTNNKDIFLQSSSRVRIATNSTLRAFMSQQGNLIFSNSFSSDPASMVGGIAMYNLTAPTGNITNGFSMYSADIVAGNAAPHFRTENGAIIKIYQETTSVATATVSAVGGSNIQTDDTFDGYTLAQVVRALRNHGLLA